MKVFLVVLSILLFGLSPNLPRAEMADLIFVNGNIYTANDKQSHADAVAAAELRSGRDGCPDRYLTSAREEIQSVRRPRRAGATAAVSARPRR